MIVLDRCRGSFNALDDFYDIFCVPNKTEDVNIEAFNTITGVNQTKSLEKHISYDSTSIFDGKRWNLEQKWNLAVYIFVYQI